jgi:hypothetical protein
MSVIKGFSTSFLHLKETFGGAVREVVQLYATLTRIGIDRSGLDTLPRWMSEVGNGTLDATGHSPKGLVLAIAGHGLQEGDSIIFTSGTNLGRFVQVDKVIDPGTIQINTKLLGAIAADDYTVYRPVIPVASSSGGLNVSFSPIAPVDFLDAGTLTPTGGSLIPRSSNNALQVVASLAARCTKLQFIQDVGIPMNLYSDAARTQLICHLPLTPDESVDVDIPAGTALFIGAAQDVDIDEPASFIEINFLG